VQVSRPAHVYLFQKSATGAVNVLFPDVRIALGNPLQPGAQLRIPQGAASFKLNDQDIGSESVYMVASLKPVAGLGAPQDAARTAPSSKAVSEVTSIDPACRSRSLALEEAPSGGGGCVRSRGLVLDTSTAGAEPSLATTTEAGDDVVATVFTFQHTP